MTIIRAIFASIFLKEKLGAIGKVGCLLSVVGAFIVVLHAPEDKDVTSIDELLFYALQPGKLGSNRWKIKLFVLMMNFIKRFCHVLYHGTLCQSTYDI